MGRTLIEKILSVSVFYKKDLTKKYVIYYIVCIGNILHISEENSYELRRNDEFRRSGVW